METLDDFVRAFVLSEFGEDTFVTHHGSTLGGAFDITGYTCTVQERHPCGYDIFYFQMDGNGIIAFCDVMSSRWIVCTHIEGAYDNASLEVQTGQMRRDNDGEIWEIVQIVDKVMISRQGKHDSVHAPIEKVRGWDLIDA